MTTLPVHLDRAATSPLGVQLSDQVRQLVVAGTLRRGDRLPSSRALATELGVSRAVAEQAYEQLGAEGWIEGRRGSGTFVRSGAVTPVPPARPRREPASPRLVRLGAGDPWLDARHRAGWRRAWREVSTREPPRGYEDPRGLPALRTALAERVARTRGLAVDADDVIVTAGATAGLRHLLAALHAGPVGVEDPGYRAAVATVQASGRAVVDVPAHGAHAHVDGLAAVYTTPAHQHPLGHVMSADDRLSLLAAARRSGTVVVEDDYDSELRYDVAPVPALASLAPELVAYLGTASKSAVPSLRVGWAVLPGPLREVVDRHREVTHDGAAWPSQLALLTLLREGWLDTVVRTARRVYAERSERVAATLGPYATPAAASAGMYSTWLMPQERAERAQGAARAAGFDVPLLSDYTRTARDTGLVVGFGGVSDVDLDAALAALARGLDD
ncbi:GntR family transcriptional regulator [Paraoerskovia sediminicola]|uniref:GntR family transcriptional regulator n=1 Tax=Paraoerskovia sediminicola TaxID=1138587 RepID=A0ABM8G5Y5_9CELL|nr:PLP-dependent aminotransferase family protein [Paraoerskovia sediminicola]BDZ43542.1 GntR family transcriptional regulator [Paraoerskovia sediminicola]